MTEESKNNGHEQEQEILRVTLKDGSIGVFFGQVPMQVIVFGIKLAQVQVDGILNKMHSKQEESKIQVAHSLIDRIRRR